MNIPLPAWRTAPASWGRFRVGACTRRGTSMTRARVFRQGSRDYLRKRESRKSTESITSPIRRRSVP